MIQFEADSRENLILYIQSSLEKQKEKKMIKIRTDFEH